jgi:hypothetical protein
MSRLTTTMATNMMFIGSRNCCDATAHTDVDAAVSRRPRGGFSPAIWFGA